MLSELDTGTRGELAPDQRLERRIAVARATTFAERLWPAVWPAVGGIGTFLALSLLDLWSLVPALLHTLLFVILLAFCLLTVARAAQTVRWPTREQGCRRLERDSAVAHRPLDAVGDRPTGLAGRTDSDNRLTAALWRVHRARMLAATRALRVGPPNVSLVRRDPRALRALVLILLVVGFINAGSDWQQRLNAAFAFSLVDEAPSVVLDVWITPPDYTGLTPHVLRSAAEGPVERLVADATVTVAEGSTVVARVHGGRQRPALKIDDRTVRFDRTDAQTHEVTALITGGQRLTIRQGRSDRASWPLDVLADRPPSVAFAAAPSATQRKSMRVDYELDDDYGVEEVALTIKRAGFGDGEAIMLTLPGAVTDDGAVTQTSFEDLTAHPWAGATVRGVLVAHDAIGQEGVSDAVEFVLPERVFTHPVARNLASIRKSLIVEPTKLSGPSRRLDEQSHRPSEFDGDLTVFTSIRAAHWRLRRGGDAQAVATVIDLLWDTALRLEDGLLSLAARDLRNAMDALADAMAEGDLDDLDSLTGALEQMMQSFLAAQLAEQTGEMPPMTAEGQTEMVGTDTLDRMIQQMRDLAAAGQTEAAMELVQQLRNIMENLSTNPMTAQDYQSLMAATRAADALDELRDQQRELLNRTSRQALTNRLRQHLGEPAAGYDDLAGQQQQLSDMLDAVQQALEEGNFPSPEGLNDARQAMSGATGALQSSEPRPAVQHQAQALQSLDDAASSLEQSLAQSLARTQAQGSRTDPLGRPVPSIDDTSFQLPDELELQEVQRILERLRRKVGDQDLTEQERDYLRRLLRRF